MTIYLDLPADASATNRRRDSVIAFLDSRGVTSEHRKIEAGVNPNATTPAARGMSGLARTDSAEGGEGASPVGAPSDKK